jgi:predicted negative regulator of RcsB-dependent stress response
MAYDLEQQESMAAMRAWFEQNANLLIGILVVVALGLAGNSGWRWYQQREAGASAALYEQYRKAVTEKDTVRAREVAAALMQDHARSAYASFAALNQARLSIDAGDATAAKAQLQFVIDRSGSAELAALARVRLAGVLLDEKSYDQGLALLDKADAPAALAAEVSDRRGDLLFAQGKAAEARTAYAKALEQAGPQSTLRSLIQSKLDALPAAG